jgi:uncharacterized integral membrane protein (TIGR00697 family)
MPFSTPKNRILYIFFGFFVANAVVAELISVKLFDFGYAIGLDENTYIMAMGLLPWPIVFLATDALNEFYGAKIVRQLSLVTSALLLYVFLIILMADSLPAFDKPGAPDGPGITDIEFSTAFSQSKYLILGSVSAFLVGQLLDIYLFRQMKKWTKGKYIWLRATGSTVVSQFVDTVMVIGIAFYLPGYVDAEFYWKMVITGYFSKLIFAVGLTPLIYAVHYLMKKVFKLESVSYEKA